MIVVAGEALIDLLLGEDGSVRARPGGGPFNAARTIGRLGLPVTFLGRLSTDRFGVQLAQALIDDGVTLADLPRVEAPTTLAAAEIAENGSARYRFYLDSTAAPQLREADVPGGVVERAQALHIGTLGLMVEPIAEACEAFASRVSGRGIVFVDPNCRPGLLGAAAESRFRERLVRLFSHADVVKVSDEDLRFLFPGEDERSGVDRILAHGARLVLLTAGAEGVHALGADLDMHVPARSVTVVDSVGAGDAFGGGFVAAWIASGRGAADLADAAAVQEAVEFAAAVAAMTCTRPGAQPPTAAELASIGLAVWSVSTRQRRSCHDR